MQVVLVTRAGSMHVQGYPSIGDVQSTVPVPVEKWYEYAGERSGRFQVRVLSGTPKRHYADGLCDAYELSLDDSNPGKMAHCLYRCAEYPSWELPSYSSATALLFHAFNLSIRQISVLVAHPCL